MIFLKRTNRNECCISRSACGLRRIVTLGEYPQTGEAQHHLSSARGPADGICVMGEEKSTLPWDGCCTEWAEHIPPEMCCEEWIQSSSFPKGVCFHIHSAATKRRDEVLTPSKNRLHRKKSEKPALFHPTLHLLQHKPQCLLFTQPHCCCPFPWGGCCNVAVWGARP